MQKISPLRAGLDAFNRFKASRLQNTKAPKTENNSAQNSTNPFGITFKGTMIQMDVFDSSTKKESAKNPVQQGLDSINKFVASARAATMNKFESIKQGAISFGNKIKENVTVEVAPTTKEELVDIINNMSEEDKKELKEMLKKSDKKEEKKTETKDKE